MCIDSGAEHFEPLIVNHDLINNKYLKFETRIVNVFYQV